MSNTRLPRATREQILEAVAELEGTGPVTIGQIGAHVAGLLGIDMTMVPTLYDLRKVMSWQGLQADVRTLAQEYALVRRSEQDWHRISQGLLFGGKPSPTTWGYCTPEGAQAVRSLALGEESPMRRQLAEQHAIRALAVLHPVEYAELVAGWLDAHPLPDRTAAS